MKEIINFKLFNQKGKIKDLKNNSKDKRKNIKIS